jgi:hypothetical protein
LVDPLDRPAWTSITAVIFFSSAIFVLQPDGRAARVTMR